MSFFEIGVTHLLGRKYQTYAELVLPKHGILSPFFVSFEVCYIFN